MSREWQQQQEYPLELYLAYEKLPVDQYAMILTAINNLHRSIVNLGYEEIWVNFSFTSRQFYQIFGFQLCIESVETGHSINVKFASEKKGTFFEYEDGDFNFYLSPMVIAPICVAGLLLTGGAWAYDKYIDLKCKQAQVASQEKVNDAQARYYEALAEKAKAETAKLYKKVNKPHKSKLNRTPSIHQINIHNDLKFFTTIINQSNINNVEINGVAIPLSKNDDIDEEN